MKINCLVFFTKDFYFLLINTLEESSLECDAEGTVNILVFSACFTYLIWLNISISC